MSARRGIGMTSARTRERLLTRLREQGIADARVIEAMRDVPRHVFVDEALASRAYEDTALPIGHNQTISQPYVVARMTEALCAGGTPAKVLEIGTGSGYQTAILARLCGQVYSIERVEALYRLAHRRLAGLQLRNVSLRCGDGALGWPEAAPFDGIMLTAAPLTVPDALLAQLAPNGRLVVPVGGDAQELTLIVREGQGFARERLGAVNFVPLVRDR